MTRIPLHNKQYLLDVRDADVGGSEFTNVLLTGATFKDVSFERARIQLARFNGATLRFSSMEGSTFEAVDMRGVVLRNCRYAGMTIDGIEVEALLAAYRAQAAVS